MKQLACGSCGRTDTLRARWYETIIWTPVTAWELEEGDEHDTSETGDIICHPTPEPIVPDFDDENQSYDELICTHCGTGRHGSKPNRLELIPALRPHMRADAGGKIKTDHWPQVTEMHVAVVLSSLASQGGHDGSPWNEMMAASEYIRRLEKMLQMMYREGFKEALSVYAYSKDGTQFVGTTGRTLKKAVEEVEQSYNYMPDWAEEKLRKAAATWEEDSFKEGGPEYGSTVEEG